VQQDSVTITMTGALYM